MVFVAPIRCPQGLNSGYIYSYNMQYQTLCRVTCTWYMNDEDADLSVVCKVNNGVYSYTAVQLIPVHQSPTEKKKTVKMLRELITYKFNIQETSILDVVWNIGEDADTYLGNLTIEEQDFLKYAKE